MSVSKYNHGCAEYRQLVLARYYCYVRRQWVRKQEIKHICSSLQLLFAFVRIFGLISGNTVPIANVQPWGNAALALNKIQFSGSGRPFFQQVYPIITSVDQTGISALGSGILTIQGYGLIPLVTLDTVNTTLFSSANANTIYSITSASSNVSSSISRTFFPISDPSVNPYDIFVGGVRCAPLEFAWVSTTSGKVAASSQIQEISCVMGDMTSVFANSSLLYLPGARGVRKDVYFNISLTNTSIESMLVGVNGGKSTRREKGGGLVDGFKEFPHDFLL